MPQEKHVDKTLGLEFTIPIGEKLAMEVGKDLKAPEGYAVIMLGYGDQPGYMYPHPVSVLTVVKYIKELIYFFLCILISDAVNM